MGTEGGALAISVMRDKPNKRDASRAFIPEAKRFVRYWESEGLDTYLALIDNHKPNRDRRAQVVRALHVLPKVKHIAIFAHGWRNGIQVGFRLQDVPALVRHIEAVSIDDAPVVSLYCCSTAAGSMGGDGGFADQLRDGLCEIGLTGCTVDGHATRGHSTRNPHMRRFAGQGSHYGGQGGQYLVQPRAKLWRAWRKALWDQGDPLRFEMGRLSIAEIHERLGAFWA